MQQGKNLETPIAYRSPQSLGLIAAIITDDWLGMLAAIKDNSRVDANGCWIWSHALNNYGYGQQTVYRTTWLAHRIAASAQAGRRLTRSDSVHHICAVKACCNPDHLQILTPQENNAEMMERTSYQRRIAELEAALAIANPQHPLLMSAGLLPRDVTVEAA